MSNKNYNNPNIRISKVYTRTGDQGDTCLVGGRKISKDDLRICSYGEIDELRIYNRALTISEIYRKFT